MFAAKNKWETLIHSHTLTQGAEKADWNFNCVPGKWSNFDKRTPETTNADFAYDYDSIMHYGPYFFR